jgi:hypothetical protein
MTPATAYAKSTAAIVAALVSALEAVQWGGAAAFGAVRRFDSDDLERAFRELLLFQQRIALVIPMPESFESSITGSRLDTQRIRPFGVVLSDRVLGNRDESVWGGADTPGSYGLLEAALPAVVGQIISNPQGVISTPTNVQPITLADAERKLPSRAAVLLELQCQGGWYKAALDVGPNR